MAARGASSGWGGAGYGVAVWRASSLEGSSPKLNAGFPRDPRERLRPPGPSRAGERARRHGLLRVPQRDRSRRAGTAAWGGVRVPRPGSRCPQRCVMRLKHQRAVDPPNDATPQPGLPWSQFGRTFFTGSSAPSARARGAGMRPSAGPALRAQQKGAPIHQDQDAQLIDQADDLRFFRSTHLRAADPIPHDHSPPASIKSTPQAPRPYGLPPALLTLTSAEQLAGYRVGGSPWPAE